MAIASLIKMRSGRGSFRSSLRYILRGGKDEETRRHEVGWVHCINVASPETAAAEMWAVASASRAIQAVQAGVYSPAIGEEPTRDDVISDIGRIMRAQGMDPDEHQIVIAQHIDTGVRHYHWVANRVSMETYQTAWQDVSWSYAKIEREVARIGAERGWDIVTGYHNAKQMAEAGQARQEIGARHRQKVEPSSSAPPLARVRGETWADAIRQPILDLVSRCDSWAALRSGLADMGLELRLVQRGQRVQGVAIGESPDRVPAGEEPRRLAGSKIDKSLSLRSLQARLEPVAGINTVEAHAQAPAECIAVALAAAARPVDLAAEIRDRVVAAATAATGWDDYHRRLADAGIEVHAIERGGRQQGLVYREMTASGAEPRRTKASAIDRSVSLNPLIARWGEYQGRIVDPHAHQHPLANDEPIVPGETADYEPSGRRRGGMTDEQREREAAAKATLREIWREEQLVRRREEALVKAQRKLDAADNRSRCNAERRALRAIHRQQRRHIQAMMSCGLVGLVFGLVAAVIQATNQYLNEAELQDIQRRRWQQQRAVLDQIVRAHHERHRRTYYHFAKDVAAGRPPGGLRPIVGERLEDVRIALEAIERGRQRQDEIWIKAGMDPEACRAEPILEYIKGYKRLLHGDASPALSGGMDELAGAVMTHRRTSEIMQRMLAETDLAARHARLEVEREKRRKENAEAKARRDAERKAEADALAEDLRQYPIRLAELRLAQQAGVPVTRLGAMNIELDAIALRLAQASSRRPLEMPAEVAADVERRRQRLKARKTNARPSMPPPVTTRPPADRAAAQAGTSRRATGPVAAPPAQQHDQPTTARASAPPSARRCGDAPVVESARSAAATAVTISSDPRACRSADTGNSAGAAECWPKARPGAAAASYPEEHGGHARCRPADLAAEKAGSACPNVTSPQPRHETGPRLRRSLCSCPSHPPSWRGLRA